MSPLGTSLIAFMVIASGAFAGIFLQHCLPESHLSDRTRDVVKLGAGLVGTIGALVLSLLIATANSTYDSQRDHVQHLAADLIMLDQLLAQFGSEAEPIRAQLRQAVAVTTDRIWRENGSGAADRSPFVATSLGEDTAAKITQIVAQNDVQRLLKDRAIQVVYDLSQTRFLLFEQSSRSLPLPFLVILVFWQTIIFASFGLLAPFNATLAGALVTFALSASGAIFLVLELSQPFSGLLQLSSVPLRNALGSL